ncbi:DMT family transporter [Crenobacter sp. SG2303]|uniref:DMT family transporter n=1 Tax=Crenobacter oryzisoli TaxID=3056844 RepID=A0ABT7XQL5_9NEIS|nr:DMT family transporter [Crenobacter sp. SG2303]MDN0076084.1 DMT family transporter [Crenobacter sp. SG2303]
MKTDIPLSVTTNAETHQSQAEQRGTALMVMGGLILGTIGIFVEEAAQSPVTTVLFRCLFGGLALLLWGLANRRLPELRLRGRALLGAIGAGLLMATNWGLFFAAIPRSSIGVATVIFHIQPFWVMAMGAWWLREKVSVQRAVAAVLPYWVWCLRQGCWMAAGCNPLRMTMWWALRCALSVRWPTPASP